MILREIAPGLSLAAMDETFAHDINLRETAKEAFFFGVQAGGAPHSIRIDDRPKQKIQTGQSFLLSFGKEGQCETFVQQNSRRAFAGIRLERKYIEHLAASRGETDLAHLVKIFESPARARIFTTQIPLAQLARAVLQNGYTGAAASLFYESSALAFIASLLSQDTNGENEQRKPSRLSVERAHEAKRLIDDNVNAPHSVQDIAKSVGINATTLRQDFLANFGKTIFEYSQEKRMARAHDLLSQNELNVSQIAFAVGYGDISSFSAAFRRYFGYPPSLVRK